MMPRPAQRPGRLDAAPLPRRPTGAAPDSTRPEHAAAENLVWFAIALLANYVVVRFFVPGPEAPRTVPYTLFRSEVAKRNVEAIYSRGETITGRFVAPVTYPPVDA
jgi:cell division protease FtsH